MTTARDEIVIDFEEGPLVERAKVFRDSPKSDAEVCAALGIPLKKGWDVSAARKLIRGVKDLTVEVRPITYRPFDNRLIFYHDSLVWRTVKKLMRHMLAGENLALIATRQTRDNWEVSATRSIIGHKALAAFDINTLFPLYRYPSGDNRPGLFADAEHWPAGRGGRRPNLSPKFVEECAGKLGLQFIPDGRGDLGKTFGPEDIFDYAYAVFHSPTYRSRYAEFLKIDFPRLPLTSSAALFRKLCALGSELAGFHLLEAPELADPKFRPRYPVEGSNLAEKPRYDEAARRVYVNAGQYFEPVPAEVWNFHVGGYQVAEKWLKDRAKANRTLSIDDLEHYAKTLASLRETVRLMAEVDKAIPSWPLQ